MAGPTSASKRARCWRTRSGRCVYASHLHVTHLKGISRLKLHQAIGVSQPAAWYLRQRIRQAFDDRDDHGPFHGPVAVDASYVGGQRAHRSNAKRKAQTGRGTAGQTAVVGMKDRGTHQVRAQVVAATDKPTLQGFVASHVRLGAPVYTDAAAAYQGLPALCYRHESVQHAAGEYGQAGSHTNGMESFRSLLQRGDIGVCHKMSPKHLDRDGAEFRGRHNSRRSDTRRPRARVGEGTVGKRLRYHILTADNGRPNGARS